MSDTDLLNQLLSANLPVLSVTNGKPRFSRPLTIDECMIYEPIIHPPTAEQIAASERLKNARITARAIPNWATWTESEALAWGETNIGTPLSNARTSLPATLTLATVRTAFMVFLNILDQMWTMQKAMARMLIALRDQNWPDLPN